MVKILSGKEPVSALENQTAELLKLFKAQKIEPCLALVRVGEYPDDIYYQQSIEKVCQRIGLTVKCLNLAADIGDKKLQSKLKKLSANQDVHGILLFCPLAREYDEKAARTCIAPEKDIDCLTLHNAGRIYMGEEKAFAPCTPRAVMELLKYYDIPVKGKNAVIIGRSLVVGKPLAMLLLKANATVTVCHSQSRDLAEICRKADILIAAAGKARFVNKDFLSERQIVIDVGINEDPDNPGKYCGDVDFEDASSIVAGITPVPGGIGALTTQVLCHHTLEACTWANPVCED